MRPSPLRVAVVLALAAAAFSTAPTVPARADAPAMPATAVGATANGRRVVVFDTRSGAEQRTLAELPPDEGAFPVVLAPDGTVFFGTFSSDGARRLWRVAGSDHAADMVAASGYAPAVSPDGRFLAYGYDRDDPAGCLRHGVALLELATGFERHLEHRGQSGCVGYVPGVDTLTWAPDSRRLAFGREDSDGQVSIVDTASAQSLDDRTILAPDARHGWISPSWLPGGRIAVTEFDSGRLLVVDPDTAQAAELTPALRYVQTVAADASGRHLVLTRHQGDFPENWIMTDGGEPKPAPFSYSSVDW